MEEIGRKPRLLSPSGRVIGLNDKWLEDLLKRPEVRARLAVVVFVIQICAGVTLAIGIIASLLILAGMF
jgi:hypothetical protein